MSKRNPKVLLNDIIFSIENIFSYTKNYDSLTFKNDRKTVDAVVRNWEIIGEASNKISEEIKNNSDDISWRQIIGLRNKVIHKYFGVDESIIWTVVREDLPKLYEKLQKLNKQLNPE